MELTPWKVIYKPGWDIYYETFPKEIRERIDKKLEQMKQPLQGRGLHHSNYQVEEVGEHRIAYSVDRNNQAKEIHFVGNHKQYEKWYAQFIGFNDSNWLTQPKQLKEILQIPFTARHRGVNYYYHSFLST